MGLLYRGLQTKPAGGLLVQEKVTSMSSLIRSDWVTCHICIFLKIQLLHSFNNVVRVTFSFPNYEANSTNNILSNPSDYITSTLQADPIKNLHAEIICRKEQRISQRPRSCGIRRETTRIISKEWMQCLLEAWDLRKSENSTTADRLAPPYSSSHIMQKFLEILSMFLSRCLPRIRNKFPKAAECISFN